MRTAPAEPERPVMAAADARCGEAADRNQSSAVRQMVDAGSAAVAAGEAVTDRRPFATQQRSLMRGRANGHLSWAPPAP